MSKIVEQARKIKQEILRNITNSEDKTLAIAVSDYYDVWANGDYKVGAVRLHPQTGAPYECITAHDSSINTDWTIDTPALWKPYHSRTKEFALPWVPPTGAHDMYKTGEFMIFTDGEIYECVSDTNYNPSEYAAAWKLV